MTKNSVQIFILQQRFRNYPTRYRQYSAKLGREKRIRRFSSTFLGTKIIKKFRST